MNAQRQIISHIPHRGMTGDQWGMCIDIELIKIWTDDMTAEECKTCSPALAQHSLLVTLPSQVLAKLDAIIIYQAQTLGWRTRLSKLVQLRLSEWEHQPNGPELMEALCAAEVRSMRIVQRQKLPPIEDPDAYLVKCETVRELRTVMGIMRADFSTRRSVPTPDEALDFFVRTVTDPEHYFVHLQANGARWVRFLKENGETLHRLVLGSRCSPANLYDQFLAWCTGWDQEKLRQTISSLGKDTPKP